jgi:hypothetical protein
LIGGLKSFNISTDRMNNNGNWLILSSGFQPLFGVINILRNVWLLESVFDDVDRAMMLVNQNPYHEV